MIFFRPLPWEYGVRNLLRRPARSALTLTGLTLVVLLVFVVVGFIRGLESTLAVSGDPEVVIVHAHGASENLENSTLPGGSFGRLARGLGFTVRQRFGQAYVSPELYLGTRVFTEGEEESAMGLVRGVTPAALLVRRQVQLIEGRWPGPDEVLVGRLAGTKLGRREAVLMLGQSVTFEGRSWRISGRFVAAGSALESELWCSVATLQLAMKRQDYSFMAMTLAPGAPFAKVDEFCKENLDLELQATPEAEYYASLQRHYRPVRIVAWLVVFLVAGAGVFTGLNTMYGAVVGRVRELAALQTLGFVRRAIALSLVQEGALLAAAGSLIAAVLAVTLINGVAVRFTMGAFMLQVDGVAVLVGCGMGLLLGVVGSIPPAVRAMRLPIVDGLKAI